VRIIRFFQLKEQLDEGCEAVAFSYENQWNRMKEYFCYGSYTQNADNATFYNLKDLVDSKDKDKYTRCRNIVNDTSTTCIFKIKALLVEMQICLIRI
jgi:hypothetical protein